MHSSPVVVFHSNNTWVFDARYSLITVKIYSDIQKLKKNSCLNEIFISNNNILLITSIF